MTFMAQPRPPGVVAAHVCCFSDGAKLFSTTDMV